MVSDDLPQQIRARVADPMATCQALGLAKGVKRQGGGGVLICCPVHNEKSPSCSVTFGKDRTLRWKCFACSASGDVLTLIAVVHGLNVSSDFVRVLELGADMAGIHVERERAPGPRPVPVRRPEPVAAPDAVDDATFAKIVAPLAHLGRLDGSSTSASVCAYLDGRGLLQAAQADGWFAMAPTAGDLLCGVFGVELVARCGLVDAQGKLKWPEHTLAIPWRTPAGLVQTIQRRHLGECEAKRRYVFPTGRGPAHPYGIEHITRRGPLALVEGAMDVLAWRVGAPASRFETPLGVPGVSGWKGDWDAIVADRNVLIAYDDDDAGNREVSKLEARFRAAGAVRVGRSTPKRGKDWADGLRRSA